MKKLMIGIMCALLLSSAVFVRAQEQTPADNATARQPAIERAQEKADADARRAREEAALKEAEILSQQGQLEDEIKKLEAVKKEKDAAVAALRTRCEQNEKTVEDLKKRSEEQKNEADEVAGSVRGIAQDLGIAISQSMVSGESPGRKKILEPLVSQTEFPALELIRQMGDLLFDEITRNGKISRSTVK